MEEDYGNLEKAFSILEDSLQFSKCTETSMLKLLKLAEKLQSITKARRVLAKLDN